MKGRECFLFSVSCLYNNNNNSSSIGVLLDHCPKARAFSFVNSSLRQMCVHSFNFLSAPKPRFLSYFCHTSHPLSLFFCTVFLRNWFYPPCFSYCWAHNIRFFSASFSRYFFLIIHSITSSETMSYPTVHYAKRTMSIDERICVLQFSLAYSSASVHQYLIRSESAKSLLTQYLIHVHINTLIDR